MHGLALVYIVRDLPGIREFKIVQESLERTRVLLVTDEAFDEGSRAIIEQGFMARLGQGVQIVVDRLQHIAPEKSGKFRYVVSHVAAE